MDHFCQRCGTARIGAFRFCRNCRFDYDEPRTEPLAEVARPPIVAAVQSRAVAASRAGTRLTGQSLISTGVLMLVGIAALGGIQRIDGGSPTSTSATPVQTIERVAEAANTPTPPDRGGDEPATAAGGGVNAGNEPQPTPRHTATTKPEPTARPGTNSRKGVFGNPWGFDFRPGGTISDPPARFCDYFDCVDGFWKGDSGYVVQCRDGSFSLAGGREGVCADHRGYRRTLRRH
jgi:hypothetical protein